MATAAALVEAVGLATIGVAQSLPVAIAGALAMGAAFSLLYPSLSLIVVERVPETRRGAALGTFTAFFDAGVGLGAPLAGAAAALTGYEGAFLLSAAIALVAATTIAVAIAGQGRALAERRADGCSSALREEQCLDAAADPAAAVGELRLGAADPVRARPGDRVDADPLPLRHALEVDGQVDVDEEELARVEDGAYPVADVGDRPACAAAARAPRRPPGEPAAASRPSPAPARGSRRSSARHSIAVW